MRPAAWPVRATWAGTPICMAVSSPVEYSRPHGHPRLTRTDPPPTVTAPGGAHGPHANRPERPQPFQGSGEPQLGPLRRTAGARAGALSRSEEHTSELQSQSNLVCRLLLEKK